MFGYVIGNANEMLAITGFGISGEFTITQKHFVWPFQRCIRFNVTPNNYEISIKAMSQEKLSFTIPASIAIGPDTNNHEQLKKYVRLMVQQGNEEVQQRSIMARVEGIIIGELRAVASNMSVEEIYNNRKYFQSKVHEYISESIHTFGLIVYNSNIKEIGDKDGYFAIMGERASAAATGLARVSIADSKATSDIGSTDRTCRGQRETTKLKTDAQMFENDRQLHINESKAALAIKEAKFKADVTIAQVESARQSEMKDTDLQRVLEEKKVLMNIEKLRAEELAQATVEAEKIRKYAEAKSYQVKKEAEARMFQLQKEAEGILYKKEKEAEGIQQLLEAQSKGIEEVLASFNNDDEAAMQFMMLEKDLFGELAHENSKAIQNLKPQFNIWTTDDDEQSGNGVANLIRALPPMLSTIQDQTGITPPSWLAKMPNQGTVISGEKKHDG